MQPEAAGRGRPGAGILCRTSPRVLNQRPTTDPSTNTHVTYTDYSNQLKTVKRLTSQSSSKSKRLDVPAERWKVEEVQSLVGDLFEY